MILFLFVKFDYLSLFCWRLLLLFVYFRINESYCCFISKNAFSDFFFIWIWLISLLERKNKEYCDRIIFFDQKMPLFLRKTAAKIKNWPFFQRIFHRFWRKRRVCHEYYWDFKGWVNFYGFFSIFFNVVSIWTLWLHFSFENFRKEVENSLASSFPSVLLCGISAF